MDLNTILGSLSFKQLLTKLRETYKKIKKENAIAESARGKEKIVHLEKRFHFIRIAEVIIKRLNILAMQDTMAVAQGFNNQIRASNITNQKQIDQIKDIYDQLLRMLKNVDRDNLIENRKAGDVVRFDRGVIGQVEAMKLSSTQIAEMKLKAANDNLRQQNYRRAA